MGQFRQSFLNAIRSFSTICTLGLIATSFSSSASDLYSQTSKAGAVATVHPIASSEAMRVLQSGGNAVDAAITAALTLGVVDSHNSGIGGGCFVLIRWADGSIEAIDGREMAPAKAHRDMYIRNGKADSNLSRTGSLAIGIPGSLAAFDYLATKGGEKTLPSALQSAASIAENGFPIDGIYAKRIKRKQQDIQRFPATANILLSPKGNPWPTGHTLKQQDLANTYRAIAKHGISYFYGGEFAKQTQQWMQKNNGIITRDDFANYQLKIREPVKTNYRGYSLYGFPPPSSGGVHVAQILNMLEGFNLKDLPEASRLHVIGEAMKLAFADRAHWLGDSDFVKVPKGLTNKSYAQALAKRIQLNKAMAVSSHSTPPLADTDLFGKHTTHLTTADAQGNWVAITSTLNTSFGSKVIIPNSGVLMNNQMDDFSAQPGVPNAYGLVGNEANSIQPGKRPLSSMSPTLILKDNQPVLTLGAAGGPTIITQVVQGVVNHLDLGLPLEHAIAAPRIHHQWKPDQLYVENSDSQFSIAQPHREKLQALGHKLKPFSGYGSTQAISLNAKGKFTAVSEPRLSIRNQ
ncbi:MAG: gamma-glutamyltransferase [Cellvibrionaceae bacterium]